MRREELKILKFDYMWFITYHFDSRTASKSNQSSHLSLINGCSLIICDHMGKMNAMWVPCD